MADLLKPDKILADLEAALQAESNPEKRAAIQEKINQRQQEIFKTSGFTNVGWGGQGYYLPGGGQGIGTEVLEPTGIPGVYTKSVITSDTTYDPYGRKSLSTEGNKKVFYDANGNPLSAADVAKTKVGQDFAAAGWDIGFGPGNLPQGTANVTADTTKVTTANTVVSPTTLASNAAASAANLSTAQSEAKSAYTLLYEQFQRYGLGSLVEPLKNFITDGLSPAEFTIKLRETDAYKKRFAANQARMQRGLRALSEAEYITLEDQYQDVMRRYGLPESYYTRGDMGVQPGFEKFISQDVSPVELEDRVQTAYNRVINANPEVSIALKNFYPGITNGDILAYALDPNEALDKIKRKITAAEIGGAAVQAGLTTNESDAEYLARYGITKEQAQQGYRTISGYLPRAQQLSSIYGKQVEGGPYTQASAEQEVFGVPGAAEAERKRKQITSLEQAAFSGSSGLTGGALGRERAGQF